jgi:hyperosmotically inducible protein
MSSDQSWAAFRQQNNRSRSFRITVHVFSNSKQGRITKMKYMNSQSHFQLASAAILAGTLAIVGCQNQPAHPDEKAAVTNSLSSSNLNNVSVSQDRDKGTITLTGNVPSDDLKNQAETLAKQAAPDYTIADEIGVRPAGDNNAGAVASNLDSAIEDNFKASIKANNNLDDQSIHAKAKNGTLVLKGSVKTLEQKREAESLAKQVPNVQQVVNELEVKPKKHSTANS